MKRTLVNLVGKRFGKLLVTSKMGRDSYGQPRWVCKCDCGNEVVVGHPNLSRSKSCGCRTNQNINLVGKKFRRLTVTQKVGLDKRGRHLWKCNCSCGNSRTVTTTDLRSGKVFACNVCQKRISSLIAAKKRTLPDNLASKHNVFNQYRNRARRSGNLFSLTREELLDITQRPCYYCGTPPDNDKNGHKYNGLDRWDNTKGYTLENVVPCCWKCNRAKGETTGEIFVARIEKCFVHLNDLPNWRRLFKKKER